MPKKLKFGDPCAERMATSTPLTAMTGASPSALQPSVMCSFRFRTVISSDWTSERTYQAVMPMPCTITLVMIPGAMTRPPAPCPLV